MRKIFLLTFIFVLIASLPGNFSKTGFCSDIDPKNSDDKKIDNDTFLGSSSNTLFSVSSDDLNPSESLNRVSGDIDRGFSSKEQTYKSSNQHKPGPYAASEEKSAQYNSSNY